MKARRNDLTVDGAAAMTTGEFRARWARPASKRWSIVMKVRNSLRSLKSHHRATRVVRRRGRVYLINKQNRRFKARQG